MLVRAGVFLRKEQSHTFEVPSTVPGHAKSSVRLLRERFMILPGEQSLNTVLQLRRFFVDRRAVPLRRYWYLLASFFLLYCAAAIAQRPLPGGVVPSLAPIDRGVMTQKPDIRRAPLQLIEGDDIRFHQIHGVNSMSQTRATPTVQDRLGFLWFGTQDGLDRFDGYKFKVFRHVAGDPGSLSGVYIHQLFIDHTGALWVGCDLALDKYDPLTETFQHFRIGRKGTNENFGPAIEIKEDVHGKLWIATLKGLFMLDPATGQTTRFTHDAKDPTSISSDGINFIDEDRHGTFWVATFSGLDAFDRSTGKVTQHIAIDGWFTFHEDRFGTFWIAGNLNRCSLAVLDRKDNHLICFSIYEDAHPVTSMAVTYTLLESQNGTMWMGTEGEGLLRYDRQKNRLVRYKNHPDDVESLGANSVVSLFEDSESQIWVDLHESVPNYFSEKPPLFVNFTHQRGSLKGSLVTSIYEDRKKVLWIGSTGGLNRIDRARGENTVPPGVGVKGEILSILEDPAGTLVAGTFRQGLQRLNPANGQAGPYDSPPGIHSNQSVDAIMRILFDHAGNLWAATWGGLGRFEPATGSFEILKPSPVDEVNYSDIKEDGKGILWLGGEEGLQRFDPKSRKFTVYRHDPDDPHSVSDHRVNSVFFDRSGGLWLGTQDGFDKFDPGSGTAKVFYEKDGLPGNVVSCILEDARGQLWMGTNNGLSSFDRQTEKFKNYSVADGLPGPDLTGWSTCYKSRDGEMFFGGFSGATSFYPSRINDNSYIPRTVLTDFQLAGSSVPIGNRLPLARSITYTQSITLSHRQNIFAIEFSTLSYFNAITNRYRYKLEGLDTEWHEVGSDQRIASYTTLPTGRYTFRVQSATSRGPWDDPGVSLDIYMQPAFWQSWWFVLACSAAILAALWAAYVARVRHITALVHLRNQERLSEREDIARDLHDTFFQAVQSLFLRLHTTSRQLPEGNPTRLAFEAVLEDSDRVMTEGREMFLDIPEKPFAEQDLGELIAGYCAEFATAYPIAYRIQIDGQPQNLNPLAASELGKIAREAIYNAFRHSRASVIEVELVFGKGELQLRVRDDGKGFEAAPPQANSGHLHLGLKNMKKRAEKLDAVFRIWTRPGTGTEVEVTVTAQRAYAANRVSVKQK
jgi:ligand-binding sensor domain-containing protein/signal transduction histidine kinase